MLDKLEFKQYNFRILNFNYIFKDLEVSIINDLHKFELLDGRLTGNAKKLFYHHIILGLCEVLMHNRTKEKTIIYYNNTQTEEYQLFKHFKETDISRMIDNILRKIKRLLPIKIFVSSLSFEYLAHLLQKNDGRSIELISNIRSYLNSINLERYTFSNIKSFTKTNGLTFLNKEYFSQLKAKQLIII
jgi:hypothetical protein